MTTGNSSRTMLALAVALGVVCGMGPSAQAVGPVIYEPFDYPAGGLNGKSGAAEIGLTGTWVASVDTKVIADSLAYGWLPTTGGSIGNLAGSINRFGGARTVSESALAGNGLLNDGATLWFSLEMGYDTGGNVTNSRLAFALANSQFSSGNYDYWITNEGAQLGSGLGVTLGRIGGVNGRVVATQFRDLASGDGLDGNILGSWLGGSSVYEAGGHGLVVGKIVWGAASGDFDTIEMYKPDVNLNLGNAISTLQVVVEQSTYDTITFARGDKVVMDEIRFAGTYEDVLGGTPSLTLRVDPVTGDTSILGGPARAVAINYYQITSAANSLDATKWSSLADQDFEGSGPPNGSGLGWEEAGGAGSGALAEAFLLGNSTIGASQTVSLGKGYDVGVGAKDLVFKYRTDSGRILDGLVEYVTSVAPGDANLDGVVDAADFILVKANFGAGGYTNYTHGDLTGDGNVNYADLSTLTAAMGAGGTGTPPIPEPATLALLGLGGLMMLRRRRA